MGGGSVFEVEPGAMSDSVFLAHSLASASFVSLPLHAPDFAFLDGAPLPSPMGLRGSATHSASSSRGTSPLQGSRSSQRFDAFAVPGLSSSSSSASAMSPASGQPGRLTSLFSGYSSAVATAGASPFVHAAAAAAATGGKGTGSPQSASSGTSSASEHGPPGGMLLSAALPGGGSPSFRVPPLTPTSAPLRAPPSSSTPMRAPPSSASSVGTPAFAFSPSFGTLGTPSSPAGGGPSKVFEMLSSRSYDPIAILNRKVSQMGRESNMYFPPVSENASSQGHHQHVQQHIQQQQMMMAMQQQQQRSPSSPAGEFPGGGGSMIMSSYYEHLASPSVASMAGAPGFPFTPGATELSARTDIPINHQPPSAAGYFAGSFVGATKPRGIGPGPWPADMAPPSPTVSWQEQQTALDGRPGTSHVQRPMGPAGGQFSIRDPVFGGLQGPVVVSASAGIAPHSVAAVQSLAEGPALVNSLTDDIRGMLQQRITDAFQRVSHSVKSAFLTPDLPNADSASNRASAAREREDAAAALGSAVDTPAGAALGASAHDEARAMAEVSVSPIIAPGLLGALLGGPVSSPGHSVAGSASASASSASSPMGSPAGDRASPHFSSPLSGIPEHPATAAATF
jgi:hypothetical protein